ncbi:MAG: SDR family NAD(P)-dependent oxidoreductase, partial [Burkholderiales bacterium]
MRMLQGQAAIVTGAGRGFGRAIAERLAAEGAAVTLAARSRAQVNAVAEAISAGGGRALAAAGDVTERRDVGRIVRAAEDAFGALTLLVNNAGQAGPFGPIGVLDPDEWWAAQAVQRSVPLSSSRNNEGYGLRVSPASRARATSVRSLLATQRIATSML